MADNSMLLDWLSGQILTELGTAQDVKAGLPMPLPAPFYAFSSTEVVGVNVDFEAVSGVRQGSQATDPYSPSKRVETQGRTRRFATALGSRENIGFDAEFIMLIQSGVPILQARAKRLQIQKVRDFRQRIENFKVNLVHSAISQGSISLDASGNILPAPATGTKPLVNFNQTYMGSNAISHSATLPNTSTTVGDWSVASTDIVGTLRAIGDSYAYTTGYAVGGIIYGRNIPTYFSSNTSLQAFMSRNQIFGRQFGDTNEIPTGMMDYSWSPGHRAYYLDSNSAVQQWFDADSLYVFPAITEDWYENIACSLPVPNGIPYAGSFEDLGNFAANFPLVRGYGSYCYGSMDPISLTCVQQHYSLPIVKSPLLWQIKTK